MKNYLRQISIAAYAAYKFKKTLAKVQQVGRKQFLALCIKSIDQAEDYLG